MGDGATTGTVLLSSRITNRNRIVAHSSNVKGWSITPSHFIGQDLTDVWLEH